LGFYWDNKDCKAFCADFDASEFDSGIVVAFCPSCFTNLDIHLQAQGKILTKNDYNELVDNPVKWLSKGAKAEYDFCKSHYIECLLVDPLLDGTRERI
jgi:hypothetical protein